MPQFTSSFFDRLDIHMQNSFSSIVSEDSIGPPDACSSPKAAHQRGKQKVTQSWNKFPILNLNFQSIKNKKAETLNIIDSYNPDIIIGTETWLTTQPIDGNSNAVAINHRLLDCTQNCGLEQMVNFPTRQRATLDLFFTNRPSLVDKCLPAPGVADHDMVHIITSATARRNKPISRKIHLWKRAYIDTSRRG